MTLQSQLAAAGAFASRKPIPKKVNLPTADGDVEVELHFLDIPAGAVRDALSGEGQDNDVRLVQRTLCEPDGTLSLEMDGEHGAAALKTATLRVLAAAALEALGLDSKVREAAKKG